MTTMSNTPYNKGDLIRNLVTIKPVGFSVDSNAYMISNLTDKQIIISFGYDEYFPHSVKFYSSIFASIRYNEVEDILHSVWVNHPNVNFGHFNNTPTFQKGIGYNLSDQAKTLLNTTEVEDDASFAIVRPYLEQMIQEALMFVSQHATLQSMYEYAELLPIEQQANFYSQPLPARKMIVKKLLNLYDYSSYAIELVDYYTQQDSTKGAFYQDLKNHLDSL